MDAVDKPYPPILKERVPDAVERLNDCSVSLHTELDKIVLTKAIVRARIDDSLITFSRAQIQDRLDQYSGSRGTVQNRLKELVEAELLSVDTTGTTHEFTLAVRVVPPAVSLDAWWSEVKSFTPTDWDGIDKRFPTHTDIPSDAHDTSELPWEESLSADHWLLHQLTPIDGSLSVVPIAESQSSNQYGDYAYTAIVLAVTIGLLGIVTIYPLGYPQFGLIFLLVGSAALSVFVPLLLFSSITDRWKDPADVRPSDLKPILQNLFNKE